MANVSNGVFKSTEIPRIASNKMMIIKTVIVISKKINNLGKLQTYHSSLKNADMLNSSICIRETEFVI